MNSDAPSTAAPAALHCLDCAAELWHCHFSLILHEGAEPECSSGPDCPVRLDLHVYTISCRETIPPCSC